MIDICWQNFNQTKVAAEGGVASRKRWQFGRIINKFLTGEGQRSASTFLTIN